MKINFLLIFIFVSFTILAYSGLFEIPQDRIGCTELNGDGCVCHSLFEDPVVQVWVEGPDTLAVGQTGLYKMFLAGGPAEAGGYNVAGMFGTMALVDSISVWDYRAPNELTQAFPLVFPTPLDTIFWPFEYTASDSSETDTIYSCGLSLVYDSIPDFHDRWNYGPKFPITVIDNVTPVELVSFSAEMNNQSGLLKWKTASELNNKGFEVEKKVDDEWFIMGFVEGRGTTSESAEYLYVDKNLTAVRNLYRLKQIDFDGKYVYSDIVELNAEDLLYSFQLNQNYPNPFNPSTTISWKQVEDSKIKLKVFDILGNEIITLVDDKYEAGNHQVSFNAKTLPSGVYLYSLETDNKKLVKKMLLMK